MVLKGSIRTKLLDNQTYRRCHHLLLSHKRLIIGILCQPLQGNDSSGSNHILPTKLKSLLPVLISTSLLMYLTQNYHPFKTYEQFCMFGNTQLQRKDNILRHWEKTIIYKPRKETSGETNHTKISILDFQPPEM